MSLTVSYRSKTRNPHWIAPAGVFLCPYVSTGMLVYVLQNGEHVSTLLV